MHLPCWLRIVTPLREDNSSLERSWQGEGNDGEPVVSCGELLLLLLGNAGKAPGKQERDRGWTDHLGAGEWEWFTLIMIKKSHYRKAQMIRLLLESLMEIQCSDSPSKFPVTTRLHYVCFYMESIQEIIISAVTKLIVAVHLFFLFFQTTPTFNNAERW